MQTAADQRGEATSAGIAGQTRSHTELICVGVIGAGSAGRGAPDQITGCSWRTAGARRRLVIRRVRPRLACFNSARSVARVAGRTRNRPHHALLITAVRATGGVPASLHTQGTIRLSGTVDGASTTALLRTVDGACGTPVPLSARSRAGRRREACGLAREARRTEAAFVGSEEVRPSAAWTIDAIA